MEKSYYCYKVKKNSSDRAAVSRSHPVSCQKSHIHETTLTGRDQKSDLFIYFINIILPGQLFVVTRNKSLSRKALYSDVLCLYLLKGTNSDKRIQYQRPSAPACGDPQPQCLHPALLPADPVTYQEGRETDLEEIYEIKLHFLESRSCLGCNWEQSLMEDLNQVLLLVLHRLVKALHIRKNDE